MTRNELSRMIDISAVKCAVGLNEVDDMCEAAKKYGFIAVFAMPWCTQYVLERLRDRPDIHVGGVVAFPSGADSTAIKVRCAEELAAIGCTEIDMVMNLGALKSGQYDYIRNELKQIRKTVSDRTMKVIIEAPLLTEEETAIAARLVADSGADFVKSGTGWQGATEENKIRIMCAEARGKCRVKVAGGVRTLDTILNYVQMGVERFGIGLKPAIDIMNDSSVRLGE